MNILVCHPESEVREMISFSLESQVGATVSQCSNFQEAVEFFLSDTIIDLVLTYQTAETDKLFKYLLSTNANIPLIVLGDNKQSMNVYPDIKVLAQFQTSDVPEKLIPLVKNHFKELKNTNDNQEFCRISTALLVRVVPLRGDIYVRLSNVKYVKLFRAGAQFTTEDLERFLHQKKVSFLYIKKQESQEFVHKFNTDLTTMIENATPGDPSLLSAVTEVQDLIQELSSRLGFTEEVQEMARSNVKLAIKTIGASPKLTRALSSSQMKSKNYISSHSVLLANISCSIAAQMKWPSDTTFQKLVLASFFHDFVFQDPTHAQISNLKKLNELKSSLSTEQYNFIKSHSIKCAEILKGLKEIPSDVDTIVLQHHERPDGTGFPNSLKAHQIAPLAAVFIVAHDIFDASIEAKGQFDLKEFLKKSEKAYQGLNFKKIWKTLMDSENDKSKPEEESAA